jgi:hypothetical protein
MAAGCVELHELEAGVWTPRSRLASQRLKGVKREPEEAADRRPGEPPRQRETLSLDCPLGIGQLGIISRLF